MSVWNPTNVQDIAESVGITALASDAATALTADVEYRLSQVLEEALRFMKHARRSTLTTMDITHALRMLDVEPLYGYESTRPLRFGEASLGPGQPLYYVSDEEVDFEKLINAPLPKVPREITMTAHWLAVEGVQPSIPQNPTSAAEAGSQRNGNTEILPKGPGANPYLPALAGMDNATVKPLVKHVLSSELQLYFNKVTSAILDSDNEEYRAAALASLRSDPGLHQLVPYLTQFVAEKVTHNLSDLFVLNMSLQLASALLDNKSLYIDPYVSSLMPPVMTCMITPRLGSSSNPLEHYATRNTAASLLGAITKRYSKTSQQMKPRLVRACLKHLLDPKKPLQSHYGAIRGINSVGGPEAARKVVVKNVKEYSTVLREAFDAGAPADKDAEMVIGAIMESFNTIDIGRKPMSNGIANGDDGAYRRFLDDAYGSLIAERLVQDGMAGKAKAIWESIQLDDQLM